MNTIRNQFNSIEQVTDQYLSGKRIKNSSVSQNGISFQEILELQTQRAETQSGVRFSKHAAQRLEDRNITLSAEQMERLENGAQKASQKGIRESLVMVDSLAFIVNIPNRTVVTAMDQTETQENIFTNIDGAVII